MSDPLNTALLAKKKVEVGNFCAVMDTLVDQDAQEVTRVVRRQLSLLVGLEFMKRSRCQRGTRVARSQP